MGFCDEQRERHADLWSRVTNHRLIDELLDDAISKRVLSRYLSQDHRFLDAFVVLLSSAISHVNTLRDRIPGCQFLALITGRENTYFERSLDALGDDAKMAIYEPDGRATKGFCDLMRESARSGELASMLSVLVVAEWSYQTWGERVLHTLSDDMPFYCREWVLLHSGEYFGSVVDYLKKLLDDEAIRLMASSDDDALGRAAFAFEQTLRLELDFFEQAYE
jgi:thiaminase/transcriptional activator TenA